MLVDLKDKNVIRTALEREIDLHIYEIGDLDPFYWPDTQWFGYKENGTISAVAMVYRAFETATLLALEDTNVGALESLCRAFQSELPDQLHAHLSEGAVRALGDWMDDGGQQMIKMSLQQQTFLDVDSRTEQLGPSDSEAVERLLKESHPRSWFSARMLETGMYYGLRSRDSLVSVAGVHVYSPQQGVAAIGNVATHPQFRRKGFSRLLVGHLCRRLEERVSSVGLNVEASNMPAIKCYEGLGFVQSATYLEVSLCRRGDAER